MRKDGRAIARKNELRVLRALRRFGWLRTRDIAALIWQRWAAMAPADVPSFEPPTHTSAGLRMAQRTLRRLFERRQILRGHGPDGCVIYALAEAGTHALSQYGVASATGKDLIRRVSAGYFRHRCISNEVAIGGIVGGFRVSSEREIAQGLWLGGKDGVCGKKPDVILRNAATSALWWVEVQRSRMNAPDYKRLLQWLDTARSAPFSAVGDEQAPGRLAISKVVFICTTAFRDRLCRDLKATGWNPEDIDRFILFETSLYSFEDITFS